MDMEDRLLVIRVVAMGLVVLASAGLGVKVTQEPGSDARARQAIELAAELAVTLPGILEEFRAERQELAEADYPQAGVTALLDSTETSLRDEVQGPDLAPLRDHIEEVFDRARSDLGLPTRAAFSPAPQATLASLHLSEASNPHPEHSRVGRVLAGIEAFIADLLDRVTRNDLMVDLCVVSDPSKAKVILHAKDGTEVDTTKTAGRLTNLFRGNYFYTVDERRSVPKLECRSRACQIDLYNEKQPALSCDGENRRWECDVQDGWPEACRGR